MGLFFDPSPLAAPNDTRPSMLIESTTQRPKLARKIGLDIVRVAAMSLVLLAHFNTNFTLAGVYGVEIFFGLSGFLVGDILNKNFVESSRYSLENVKIFWFRRWWRTWPNYFLLLAFSLLIGYHSGTLPTLKTLAQFLFLAQNFFKQTTEFYGVAWALCVEEWSYFLFPLAILLFVSFGLSNRRAFLISIILFLIFPPVIREFLFATTETAFARIITSGRLDAVFYGVATSFIVRRCKFDIPQKRLLAIVGVAGLILFGLFQIYCFRIESMIVFYRVALVALPLCFSLLLPWVSCFERLPASFSYLAKPISAVSLWSYSIYLSHLPILFLTYDAFGSTRDSVFINILSKFTGLAVCLLFSFLIFRYFESPLTKFRPSVQHAE